MPPATSILVEDPNDPGTYIITTMNTENPDEPGYYPIPQQFPTKLVWDDVGDRRYEAGVDRGVLYVGDQPGVVWNGLISVDESPIGGNTTPYYIDGYNYASPSTLEEWGASMEAFTYPDEFGQCDGSEILPNGLIMTQQQRREFNLSYRTLLGNDVKGTRLGYKIHLVYNVKAEPTDREYQTVDADAEAMTFNWNLTARPRKIVDPSIGTRYSAHFVLDSTKIYPWAMQSIEEVLYGTPLTDPRMPSPQELLDIFEDNALLPITDNGDGTWTATGPDSIVSMLDEDTFQISWPSAVYIDADTYTINSL